MKLSSRLAVFVAVAAGLLIAAMAGSIGPFRNRSPVIPAQQDPRPPQVSNRPHVIPPAEPRRPTPLSEADPAAAQDEAKGIYVGPLGQFVVTPREAAAFPPCPRPYGPAPNIKASELYSPVFGENLEETECAGGRLLSISCC